MCFESLNLALEINRKRVKKAIQYITSKREFYTALQATCAKAYIENILFTNCMDRIFQDKRNKKYVQDCNLYFQLNSENEYLFILKSVYTAYQGRNRNPPEKQTSSAHTYPFFLITRILLDFKKSGKNQEQKLE